MSENDADLPDEIDEPQDVEVLDEASPAESSAPDKGGSHGR